MTLIVGSANSMRSRRLTRGASNAGVVCRHLLGHGTGACVTSRISAKAPRSSASSTETTSCTVAAWLVVTTARDKARCLVGLDRRPEIGHFHSRRR